MRSRRWTLVAIALALAGAACAQSDPLAAPFRRGNRDRRRSTRPTTATGNMWSAAASPPSIARMTGAPSVLIAGGEKPAKFFRNVSTPRRPAEIRRAGERPRTRPVVGAYPIDIDGDGEVDLVVLRVGEIDLMRGLGSCRFERANEAWGFKSQDAWWTAFSATWEKGQEWPTLAFGSYYRPHQGPRALGHLHAEPALPAGRRERRPQRRFADPVPLKPSFCPLSMLFSDWNRSGTPSLRVANDREYYEGGQEQMWRVAPGEAPRLYTEAEGWKYLRIWGMGIASYDLAGSGYPDYFITCMADHKLQRLDRPAGGGAPKPSYTDIAFKNGVTAHRPYAGGDVRPSTGWHAQFEDVNNSGRLGPVRRQGQRLGRCRTSPRRTRATCSMQTRDGKFVEMGDKAGIVSFAQARGAALADFNLDGAVDILVVNRNAPVPRLAQRHARASATGSRSRRARAGRTATRSAAGSRCAAATSVQRRELTIGGGHAGRRAHLDPFRPRRRRRRRRRGSSGRTATTSDWRRLAGDAFYLVHRGAGPARWTPPG